MTTTTELEEIRAKALAALAAVDDDPGASPVLQAVVREFTNKANKAVDLGAGDRAWEAVVELEQAGDSAKAAAEADVDAAPATTTSVRDAHLAICMLKAGGHRPGQDQGGSVDDAAWVVGDKPATSFEFNSSTAQTFAKPS